MSLTSSELPIYTTAKEIIKVALQTTTSSDYVLESQNSIFEWLMNSMTFILRSQ
jgi:hypothetical protein